jgi:RNA polymerase sigma factor (sigma-70 family)
VRSAAEARAAGRRKRAAIEIYARYEAALRRTAQRYSQCAEDAEDALQRGFEILLRKAPTDDPRQLIRWTQTVVKHEALAVRRERERVLGAGGAGEGEGGNWVTLIPSPADGPPELAERREAVARGREALQALKPPERRALGLLAEGYSYAEIGEITGYSRTKINRLLAEGRQRFRSVVSGIADGGRCAEMGPAISAFCDGEAGDAEAATVREHLRACAGCRATVRAYRAAPAAAAALLPALPAGRSLPGRLHDALADLAARLRGGGVADSAISQVAAGGGARGAGTMALAKAIAVCVGTAGGAAACAATGVVPIPFAAQHDRNELPPMERAAPAIVSESGPPPPVAYEAEPEPLPPTDQAPEPPSPPAREPEATGGGVGYVPPPAPAPAPTSSGEPGGSPAGEFGP